MATRSLYRKVALERIASPDQLDLAMTVTSPRRWLALLGLWLLLGLAVAWGMLGRVPTNLVAQGILIHGGGMREVQSPTAGQITTLHVHAGDHVEAGAAIAAIAQPELEREIRDKEQELAELRREQAHSQSLGEKDIELRTRALAEQRRNLRRAMATVRQHGARLRKRAKSQTALRKQGLITKQQLEATLAERQAADLEIGDLRDQVRQLDIRRQSLDGDTQRAGLDRQHRVNEAERALEALRARLAENTTIPTKWSGRVLEVRAGTGDLLRLGGPILNLEVSDGGRAGLEAVLYATARDGKRIREEMVVQVAPSTVRREEHGYLRGEVRSVARFPATHEGMMRTLANEQLVASFLARAEGTPIEVRVRLRQDSATPSGYAWSSGTGPPITLDAGTLCVAEVTIEEQRPIELVIPAFKRVLGR